MNAYQNALDNTGTTMVLSPDSDFFRYFNSPAGAGQFGPATPAVPGPAGTGAPPAAAPAPSGAAVSQPAGAAEASEPASQGAQ